MSRSQAWLLHMSNALVASTGLAYAWCAYLATNDDPYALVNHPLQPAVQHAHVLCAPLLVFAVGVTWAAHALPQLRLGTGQRRRSGWGLLSSFAPAAVSGYAVQVSSDPQWRELWVLVHLSTSGLWVVCGLLHLLRAEERRSEQGAQSGSMSSSTRG